MIAILTSQLTSCLRVVRFPKGDDISLTATNSIFAVTMTSKMSFNDVANIDDVFENLGSA